MNTSNHKKINVVLRYFLPVTAGIEINVWQTYRMLAKQGWDITIHTTTDTYTETASLSKEEVIDGLKVRRYKHHLLGFKPEINWNETDAVCLHNFDIFPHVWILLRALFLKLTGKKKFFLFVTPHGGFCPEWSVFPYISRNIKRFYTNTFGVFLINRVVDGVRAVSPWEAEEMKNQGIKENLIQVITNGLENEAYADIEANTSVAIKKIVSEAGTYIMDNSRIKPIKNIESIINALSLLPENIHFIHIGTTQDFKYRESILALVASLNLEHRVHFLGVVRGFDKYYLYKHALTFVHPAIWEANANVVHEAWSQRLITIVGDSTGMRSQVKDSENGYRVPVHDIRMLAMLINKTLVPENYDLLEAMRSKNMDYVYTHSWKEVGKRMGEFYLNRMSDTNINSFFNSTNSEELNERIELIIKNKIPCYFISPHLDDAVFSAGSLISHLSKYTDVNVISVFTKSLQHKTLSVRGFLMQCGYKDAKELFDKRREEDIKVCKSIGAKAIHLGFVDALWRTKKVGIFRNLVSKILPEANSIYPTHRFHIAKGITSLDDEAIISEIRNLLENTINITSKGNYAIFGPAAIGNHVDHVIVHDVCEEMFPDTIFWADMPYILNIPQLMQNNNYCEKEIWQNSTEKGQMLKLYKSQYKAMFGDKALSLPPEIFYAPKLIEKKFKVSVGIPAYNEEANIKNLLESILDQKEVNFELLEIIVVSDGSTDKTVEEARSIASKKISVIEHEYRQGAAKSQNSILKEFKGDILLLLDADILPSNKYYLGQMVAPFYKDENLGIVSNNGIPTPAETFFETIINFSVYMKIDILEQFKDGDNIYMCHGFSRAFSRACAKKMEWPYDVTAEDAYSYLRSKELGFNFFYQPKAHIYYKSPKTFIDHVKQSSRFITSKKKLAEYYSEEKISDNFKLPFSFLKIRCIRAFLKNPFMFTSYVLVYCLVSLDALFKDRASSMWEQSYSSKMIIKK
ncbi:MAG: glycosyltransferase [Patescibacteria group bacterium]